MKKTIITTILLFFSVLFLSSCNNGTNNVKPEPPWFLIKVTGEDVFEKGYHAVTIYNSTAVNFSLSSDSAEHAGWYIYVADDELPEDEIEALKETEPALTGSGSLELKHGQWVYIFCDVNSENSDKPTKDVLSISYPADYI